jgi:hypothetical protein
LISTACLRPAAGRKQAHLLVFLSLLLARYLPTVPKKEATKFILLRRWVDKLR